MAKAENTILMCAGAVVIAAFAMFMWPAVYPVEAKIQEKVSAQVTTVPKDATALQICRAEIDTCEVARDGFAINVMDLGAIVQELRAEKASLEVEIAAMEIVAKPDAKVVKATPKKRAAKAQRRTKGCKAGRWRSKKHGNNCGRWTS